jgi:16S rRNA (cytosine967-C5)-methyltransferase
MAISPARTAAFDMLLRVEQTDAYASELLHSTQYRKLTSANHGLATELVMGVLRWKSLLDRMLAADSSLKLDKLDIEVLTALRLAAYQLRFLERVPGRAAVHESVELVKRARKRSAAAFVNAVLRKLAERVGKQLPEPDAPMNAIQLSGELAHPAWLVERWVQEFGFEAASKICAYDQRPPQTSLQLARDEVADTLQQEGIDLLPGELLQRARRVHTGDITHSRTFLRGEVAIQDEASQLVALLVARGASVLDCCAAPGGKARVIAEANPDSVVVALELHPQRALLMRKLVSASNLRIISADARQIPLAKKFDRILADVPCSGTGTLARNPEIKWRLQPADLHDLQQRQLAILQSAMASVAPGGRLVYSTCSLEREENSDVVEKAMGSESAFHLVDAGTELERLRVAGTLVWHNIDALRSGPFLRTLPGVHPCDGFFAAIIERR